MSVEEESGPHGHGRRRAAGRRREDARRHRPAVQLRDARPRVRGLLADLPHPSLSALAGVVVLLLVAAGAVHLSTRGTAVPLDPPVAASGGPAEGHPASDGGGEGSTAPTEPPFPAPSGAGTVDPSAEASSRATGEVVVHVSGAVGDPGVVRLPAGSRVDDALREAGGAEKGADLDRMNLARPLTDGEHIHVPMPGEELPVENAPGVPENEVAEGSTPGGAADGSEGGGGAAPVDLNTADAAALETLTGVGPAIAQRIIDYRETNGPFTSVDELEEVSGIGSATLEKLRDQVRV